MSFLLDILNSVSRALPKNPLLLAVISKATGAVSGEPVRAVRRLFTLPAQRQRLSISVTEDSVEETKLSRGSLIRGLAFSNSILSRSSHVRSLSQVTYRAHQETMNSVETQAYKVSFRCPEEERKKFSVSRCLLPISVGQVVHEGEKLRDTLEAINKTFSSCVILVDDSIQAATRMLAVDMRNFSMENQWQTASGHVIQAILEGDKWLSRNRVVIESKLMIPIKIMRWYEWRTDPDFNRAIQNTHAFYYENENFRNAVNENIAEFLTRYEKKHPVTPGYIRERAEWFCREYLLEECAVMMHLWPKLRCEYEVYPSGRNAAMQAAYELFIQPRYPHLLKSVALRFHKIEEGLAKQSGKIEEQSKLEEGSESKLAAKP